MTPAEAVYFLAMAFIAGSAAGLFSRLLRVRG